MKKKGPEAMPAGPFVNPYFNFIWLRKFVGQLFGTISPVEHRVGEGGYVELASAHKPDDEDGRTRSVSNEGLVEFRCHEAKLFSRNWLNLTTWPSLSKSLAHQCRSTHLFNLEVYIDLAVVISPAVAGHAVVLVFEGHNSLNVSHGLCLIGDLKI